MTPIAKQDVNIFKSFYKQSRAQYPEGALIVQSSSSHCWPYPALLYKRGVWPAVDVMFFLCDIPMTFMAEISGGGYRRKTTNIFTKVNEGQTMMSTSNTTINTLEEQGYSQGVKQYAMGLEQVGSIDRLLVEKKGLTGQVLRLASGVSLSQLNQHQIEGQQKSLNKELGPEYGYHPVHEALGSLWTSLGVPHLDLLGVYGDGRFAASELLVNEYDAHPNERAHAVAAEAMEEFLDDVVGR